MYNKVILYLASHLAAKIKKIGWKYVDYFLLTAVPRKIDNNRNGRSALNALNNEQ